MGIHQWQQSVRRKKLNMMHIFMVIYVLTILIPIPNPKPIRIPIPNPDPKPNPKPNPNVSRGRAHIHTLLHLYENRVCGSIVIDPKKLFLLKLMPKLKTLNCTPAQTSIA
jgi:hypothetical protein